MTISDDIRQAIARGWCDQVNSSKVMDVDIADAIHDEVMFVIDQVNADRQASCRQTYKWTDKGKP